MNIYFMTTERQRKNSSSLQEIQVSLPRKTIKQKAVTNIEKERTANIAESDC